MKKSRHSIVCSLAIIMICCSFIGHTFAIETDPRRQPAQQYLDVRQQMGIEDPKQAVLKASEKPIYNFEQLLELFRLYQEYDQQARPDVLAYLNKKKNIETVQATLRNMYAEKKKLERYIDDIKSYYKKRNAQQPLKDLKRSKHYLTSLISAIRRLEYFEKAAGQREKHVARTRYPIMNILNIGSTLQSLQSLAKQLKERVFTAMYQKHDD